MSSASQPLDPLENRDDKVIAAEMALGLLEDQELSDARARLLSDPVFAARKVWWDNWFVPLSDDVAAVEPPAHLWHSIAQKIADEQNTAPTASAPNAASTALIERLTVKLRRWQWAAGLAGAAAVIALGVSIAAPAGPVIAPGGTDTPRLASSAPLMASIPIGDSALRVDVTFLPEREEILVSAEGLVADGVHDHELWLQPGDGGELLSLGLIDAGTKRRVALPQAATRNMAPGANLVLTREPLGGKPEGQVAGPVVAQGSLEQV